MPPPAASNGMLSGLLQTGEFSDCTIVCQGKEFKLHKVIVCAQSSTIATALEKAWKESQSSRLHITNFDLAAVECMVYFLYHADYIINGDVLRKANTSEWAPPPNMQVNGFGSHMPANEPPSRTPPPAVVRDSLLCHVEVSAIGRHYKLPKLCDRANRYIKDILSSDQFTVEIFPYLAIAAYKSSEHANLHDLVFSFAVEHIKTLLSTPSFEKVTALPNFGFKLLQQTVAKLQANENQLVETQDQRAQDQENIESLKKDLSGLKERFSVVSTKCNLSIEKNLDLAMETSLNGSPRPCIARTRYIQISKRGARHFSARPLIRCQFDSAKQFRQTISSVSPHNYRLQYYVVNYSAVMAPFFTCTVTPSINGQELTQGPEVGSNGPFGWQQGEAFWSTPSESEDATDVEVVTSVSCDGDFETFLIALDDTSLTRVCDAQ